MAWRRFAGRGAAFGLFEGFGSDDGVVDAGGEERRDGGLSRIRSGGFVCGRSASGNGAGLSGVGAGGAQAAYEGVVRCGAESCGAATSVGERSTTTGLVSRIEGGAQRFVFAVEGEILWAGSGWDAEARPV